MHGFRGRFRQLLRASLQQRLLAGSSHSTCQCPNALGLRTDAVQQLDRTVRRGLPGLQNLPFGLRGLQCSRPSLESVNVEVASFGESITEGSIAGILKKPGEGVKADEVLFQIETDKVTIDVRAPQSGTVEEILVKEDETVTVGQVLAKIAAGEAPSQPAGQGSKDPKQEDAAAGAAPADSTAVDTESQKDSGCSPEDAESARGGTDAAAEAAKEPVSQEEADKDAESATTQPQDRKPGIRFPNRRTPDGKRVSMLSIEEQQRYLGEGQPKEEQAQAAPQSAAPLTEDQKSTVVTAGPWYAGKERGTKLSQSRVLSEREMEMIELGGALD